MTVRDLHLFSTNQGYYLYNERKRTFMIFELPENARLVYLKYLKAHVINIHIMIYLQVWGSFHEVDKIRLDWQNVSSC